jgi:NAD(P) transhydrogenase subunit alpha
VLGPTNLASEVPYHASQMFSKNVTNFLTHLANEEGALTLDLEDAITQGALLTHEGRVVPEVVRERLGNGGQG